MRNAFFDTLYECAKEDEKIIFLTGDLGYHLVDKFVNDFPDRFINAGIAESNMISVAAGLALEGFKPYVYSIAPFVTMRPFEHIRNDVVHNNLNVKIVGVGGGYAYGRNGSSHHSVEDIAIMRTLPGMTVVAPGDPVETKCAIKALVEHNGPAYLRLGRSGECVIHQEDVSYKLGEPLKICCGKDVLILSTGAMLKTALEVKDNLQNSGYSCELMSVHTIKPFPESTIYYSSRHKKLIITIEEHSMIGGLYSACVETQQIAVLPFAIPDNLCHFVGDQDYLREIAGLTVQNITEKTLGRLKLC